MKIAINTPTGNIGRTLAANLLDSGEELVLLTRSPEKTKAFAGRDRGEL
jgi:putative NADH-flavin reductase